MRYLKASKRHPHRQGGILVGLIVVLVLAGVGGYFAYDRYYKDSGKIAVGDLITTVTTQGPFDHIVLEQGEIESSSNIEVVCNVESRGGGGTEILWVIDEGTRVKEGDKLCELDSSQLETELRDSTIRVITAEADYTNARAMQQQAEISKQEYLEGVYMTEKKAIESEMLVAQQTLRKAELAFQSSERLVSKGLIKSLQLEADQFAVANAKNKLEAEQGRLKVLETLTKKKMLVQYDSDIESTKARVAAAKSELDEEKEKLQEVKDQISGCVLYAPADGVVVHANRYSSRGGNAEFVVEAGASVRERQAIIRLPDPSKMQIKCNVNESQITLISPGMPVKIKIDALPDLQLKGRVIKVNRYAEPGSWMSSSIKEYATLVEILNPPEVIRTGMTAEVQIFVEQLPEAIQIPIQGLYEHGNKMYTMVQTSAEEFDTRQITIGATNDTMASIEDGIEAGETVVLNLRQHLDLMDLPELTAEDNSDLRDIGKAAPEATGENEGRRGAGGEGRPGGGQPGVGQRDGGPGGQRGGGTGGPPAGGGAPNIGTIVSAIMSSADKDGDGKISKSEVSGASERSRGTLSSADSDGDGDVSKAELTAALKKRMGQGGGGR